MTFQLYLQTAAINDLQDAVDWYEAQKLGFGQEFLSAVGEILGFIEENPLIFVQVYRQKRRAALRRFPYNVIYVVEGDIIRVSAIMHGKKDPAGWKKRK